MGNNAEYISFASDYMIFMLSDRVSSFSQSFICLFFILLLFFLFSICLFKTVFACQAGLELTLHLTLSSDSLHLPQLPEYRCSRLRLLSTAHIPAVSLFGLLSVELVRSPSILCIEFSRTREEPSVCEDLK